MKNKYITIIGSRNISQQEYNALKLIATKLHDEGYILRSGGADGSDSSINHLANIEIYIPWNGFNGFTHNGKTVFELSHLPDIKLAEQKIRSIHPAASKLKMGAFKLHTRNIYQVIGYGGQNGVKSDAVIYCSEQGKDGNPLGGTRTAVVYAKQLKIPVFNIRNMLLKGEDESTLPSTLLGRIRGE